MKRIALLSFWSCPLTQVGIGKSGGMSIYMRNIAKAFSQKGIEVDIFTKGHREPHEVEELGKNIHIIHTISFANDTLEFIQREKRAYDFLYSQYYRSAIPALKIKKKVEKPLFHTFHSLQKLKDVYETSNKKRFPLEKTICSQVDKIIALSSQEKETLQKYYSVPEKKITISTPGVDHALFRKIDKTSAREIVKLPQNKIILLFVGRLEKVKGVCLVLDAYKTWESQNKKNTKLVIIGEGKESQASLGKETHEGVIFLGNKKYEKLPYYYAAADILIIPSYAESFGLTALEGMAMGLPIIASKVGGLTQLIKNNENGLLFNPGNMHDLTENIDALVKNKATRHNMGINSYIKSKKYSWDKTAETIINLYNEKYYS